MRDCRKMRRPYKKLINHADFEIPLPTRQSVIGFFVVLGIAAMMIAGLLLFVAWMRL